MTIGGGHELKYAAVSASSSGANTLVAAVTGQTIKVTGFAIVSAGTVAVTFKSGASPSLTGAMPLVINQALVVTGSTNGILFETASGAALTVTLSDAIAITGFLTYIVQA